MSAPSSATQAATAALSLQLQPAVETVENSKALLSAISMMADIECHAGNFDTLISKCQEDTAKKAVLSACSYFLWFENSYKLDKLQKQVNAPQAHSYCASVARKIDIFQKKVIGVMASLPKRQSEKAINDQYNEDMASADFEEHRAMLTNAKKQALAELATRVEPLTLSSQASAGTHPAASGLGLLPTIIPSFANNPEQPREAKRPELESKADSKRVDLSTHSSAASSLADSLALIDAESEAPAPATATPATPQPQPQLPPANTSSALAAAQQENPKAAAKTRTDVLMKKREGISRIPAAGVARMTASTTANTRAQKTAQPKKLATKAGTVPAKVASQPNSRRPSVASTTSKTAAANAKV